MNHFNRDKFIEHMKEVFPEPMKYHFTYNLLENIVDFVIDLCEHDDAPENIVPNLVDLIPGVGTEEVERWVVNGYRIDGNKKSGYEIREECYAEEFEDAEVLERCDDFESAMTWCLNS